ncbi:hypothetical protein TGAM01_v206192 [Trichoderma gamsii]|uniref:Uncharacterized protein n=1 Tax=Trichoderma gamsii TaxID=398673 RepID=A0A2P4ZLD8_9HYPO|nr:hypothetical protein TGAM01_v206192 [Trichoderma gamsii]PON25111.1 hypothetical protein TGAM01_v206192 [Trichoderma gamsii]
MPELVYHNGHYHEAPRRDRRHKKRDDSWNVMKVWDEVLYNIGDLYYKCYLRTRTATFTRSFHLKKSPRSSTARIVGSQTARIRALLSVPWLREKGDGPCESLTGV